VALTVFGAGIGGSEGAACAGIKVNSQLAAPPFLYFAFQLGEVNPGPS
jgi:hypothetical protein